MVTGRKYAELIEAAGRATAGQRSGPLQLAKDLARQLSEYEAVRDGHTNVFLIDDIDDLGDALIQARLARGWTHRVSVSTLTGRVNRRSGTFFVPIVMETRKRYRRTH